MSTPILYLIGLLCCKLQPTHLLFRLSYHFVRQRTGDPYGTRTRTGLFQTLVMECPWEKSQHIKNHFDPVNDAIS